MNAIEIRGLSKRYKSVGKATVHSVDQLTLDVGEREIFGFLGRNGAGKTTTIKMLVSLLKPTAGEASIFGENARTRQARRLVGYLPEQPYFYEYLTPRETIDFYGKLRGLSHAERHGQWDKLSELLDLRDIAAQRIKGFSKGMRQRIGFAVALVGDPPLLILDEPMSGLDPVGRRNIRQLMLHLRDEKKTLFFSSHVLGDVEQICDRVSILVKGKLARQGRIDDLLGARENRMEVVAAGISPASAANIKAAADFSRELEGNHIYTFHSVEAANASIASIQAAGGIIIEMNPIRESLEEYFMREEDPVKDSA